MDQILIWSIAFSFEADCMLRTSAGSFHQGLYAGTIGELGFPGLLLLALLEYNSVLPQALLWWYVSVLNYKDQEKEHFQETLQMAPKVDLSALYKCVSFTGILILHDASINPC